jgi:preprotein translocase subunit SecE
MGRGRGSAPAKGQQKKRFGAGAVQFVRDVRRELGRVNWPGRDQLRQSTAVVLIVVILLGIYVAAWDFVFQGLYRFIFLP